MPSRRYRQVIKEEVPLRVQAALENEQYHVLKSFQSISLPDGQPSREIYSQGLHNCTFLSNIRLALDQVESFLQAPSAAVATACKCRLNPIAVRYQEEMELLIVYSLCVAFCVD